MKAPAGSANREAKDWMTGERNKSGRSGRQGERQMNSLHRLGKGMDVDIEMICVQSDGGVGCEQ